uniref:Periodic tryptophan protein 1 homolog n=1 Tax=Lepeophtheirus salmonis TaxID=72036 RepID=C1BVG9_LEPSM|nr:Periodic tryptophan protein 1 homolog [Lepeophtheirus salmonis]
MSDDEGILPKESINFIPCLKFVKRGIPKSIPEKVKLDPEDLAKIISNTRKALSDQGVEADASDEDSEENPPPEAPLNPISDDIAKEYDMDNYDDEDTKEGDPTLGIGDLVLHADPKEDPYLNQEINDEDSDAEDYEIKSTDNLILAGHVEGEAATLEVYVYNDKEGDLYVHHDLILPSLPLTMEWLSYEPGESTKGNLVAVGYMTPIIDVWDLDIVDCLEAAYSLGNKSSKKKKLKRVGHSDAVLSLSWNHHVEHILASGSVDQTVLLWDLNKGIIASKISAHMEKVQSLQWHPFESQSLATGACDQYVRIFDCRAQDSCKAWKVEGEVEKVLWNHFNPFTLFASTESGHIQMIDVRKDDAPIWTLHAHSDCINGISLSTQCPDCLVTVSSDKTLKVWDIPDNKPTCIHERNMKLGQLHCLDNCPDAPFLMAIGGDKNSNNFKVFDIRESSTTLQHFGSRKLVNPLGMSDWGFETANEAEVKEEEMETEAVTEDSTKSSVPKSGGAIGKFKKKSSE